MHPCIAHGRRPLYNPTQLPCPVAGYLRIFRSYSGRTKHVRCSHPKQICSPLPRCSESPSSVRTTVGRAVAFNTSGDGMDNVPEAAGVGWPSSPLPYYPQGNFVSQPSPQLRNDHSPQSHSSVSNSPSHFYHPLLDGKFVLVLR
jgi:hypothetical protein